jgi:transaldolase
MPILDTILNTIDANNYHTKIIAASIRNIDHIENTAKAGCHIATIPFQVINDMMNDAYYNQLTEDGLKAFNVF